MGRTRLPDAQDRRGSDDAVDRSASLRTEPYRTKRQKRLTIGELARRAGVGVEAVRYYQKRGLVAQPPRPLRGFRVYPDETLERLVFVRRAREIGFPVDAIGELLSLRDTKRDSCAQVRLALARQIAWFEERIRDLDARRAIVVELLRECQGDPAAAHCETLATFYTASAR